MDISVEALNQQLFQREITNIEADIDESTPLHYTCMRNDAEAVKMLLSKPNIDVNALSKEGYTAIMVALTLGRKDALQLLANDHRVNLDSDVQSMSGWTLQWMEELAKTDEKIKNHIQIIRNARHVRIKEERNLSELLENDLNEKDENGQHLLHRSLYQNNRKAVVTLLSTPGIDVNIRTKMGSTPLMYACLKNNTQAVKLLLAAPDIEVNCRDTQGITPIMLALLSRSRESTQLLLVDYRVDLDEKMKCNRGRTLEDCIVGTEEEKKKYLKIINKARNGRMKQNKDMSEVLRKSVMNQLIITSPNGKEEIRSLLLKSLICNNNEVVSALLFTPGVDVNYKNPLISACAMNNVHAIKILLKSPGIEVNSRDADGKNAIMEALAWCSRDALNLLVDDLRVDLDNGIKSKCGTSMDEWVGKYGEHRGYGEYVDTAKNECLKILYEGRRMQKKRKTINIDDIEAKMAKMAKTIEAAKKSLECPVCLEEMMPPTRIWMCSLSHTVCEHCKNKLEASNSKCPECRTEKITLRALNAEHFATAIFT